RVQPAHGRFVQQRAAEAPEGRRVAVVAQVAELVDECAHDGARAAPVAALAIPGTAHLDQRLAFDIEATQSIATSQTQAWLAPKWHRQAMALEQRLELAQEQYQEGALHLRRRGAREGGSEVGLALQTHQPERQLQPSGEGS